MGFYLIFWMLFIYYCFQAIDEIFELFTYANDMQEKGVMGLLFEINYFFGLYITYKVVNAYFRTPDECKRIAP